MRIVFAGPQLGAVSDLAVALQSLGHDVAALLPYDEAAAGRTRSTRVKIPVRVGGGRVTGEILLASGPENLPCYLIRSGETPPPDTSARGIFHSQTVVELARRLVPAPDVLQLSGWEAGLAPAYARLSNLPFRTVLEIHEVTHQGSFDGSDFASAHLPTGFFSPGGVEFFGRMNFLKGGLVLADAWTVNGTSTLAALRQEPAGHGLSTVIAEQSYKCAPMLRAADAAPRFSDDKAADRSALLSLLGVAKTARGSIVVLDRTTTEGGDGHLPAILDRWIATDTIFVCVTLRRTESAALEAAARRSPKPVHILRQPDDETRRRVVAGADFQIFPAAPSVDFTRGALHAMRCGTIPLAPDHPGRAEIFGDCASGAERGEGLVWFLDSADALWDTALRATELFRHVGRLGAVRRRAVERATGITAASLAEAHVALYHRLGVA